MWWWITAEGSNTCSPSLLFSNDHTRAVVDPSWHEIISHQSLPLVSIHGEKLNRFRGRMEEIFKNTNKCMSHVPSGKKIWIGNGNGCGLNIPFVSKRIMGGNFNVWALTSCPSFLACAFTLPWDNSRDCASRTTWKERKLRSKPVQREQKRGNELIFCWYLFFVYWKILVGKQQNNKTTTMATTIIIIIIINNNTAVKQLLVLRSIWRLRSCSRKEAFISLAWMHKIADILIAQTTATNSN